jgi:hypothetical protein
MSDRHSSSHAVLRKSRGRGAGYSASADVTDVSVNRLFKFFAHCAINATWVGVPAPKHGSMIAVL